MKFTKASNQRHRICRVVRKVLCWSCVVKLLCWQKENGCRSRGSPSLSLFVISTVNLCNKSFVLATYLNRAVETISSGETLGGSWSEIVYVGEIGMSTAPFLGHNESQNVVTLLRVLDSKWTVSFNRPPIHASAISCSHADSISEQFLTCALWM